MKNNKTDATKVLKFFREAREAKQGGETDPPKQTNHLGSLDDPIKKPVVDFKHMSRWEKRELNNALREASSSYSQI